MSQSLLRSHGETHTGNVREANEDTLLVVPELGLYAVFDGMGGHMAGDVASSKARDTVHAFVRAHRGSMDPKQLLGGALNQASAAVHSEAKSRRDRHGMGTTAVVVLMTSETEGVLAHVGDSRAYLLRDGRMQLLTHDHTVVAELIANGAISPEEAVHHPYKSVLSRNLGAKPETRPDFLDLTLQAGDKILLCSDGLTGFASHDAVEQLVGGGGPADGVCIDLVELALKGGGGDNVTVVLIELGRPKVPRSTLIVRESGSAAWWQRRAMFLSSAAQRGLAQSPICAVLSADEALEIVAGNLCEAIYHDLEHTTGINVWTYAENLVNGWLDQDGDLAALRQMLDLLRAAAMDVLADIARSADFGVALESSILRSFTVAEMAVGGALAERLKRVESEIVNASTHVPQRAETEQPTVPYMRAMKVDPPTPEVADCLNRAIHGAQAQLHTMVETAGADACLQVAHKVCVDPVGDASLAARELYGGRALEEAGVTSLLEALETARAVHLAAIKQLDADRTLKAVAMRRVATSHQRLYVSLARLVVDAGKPISDSLQQAAETTAQLRARLGQGEARLAKLERMLVTQIDGSPNGFGGGK